MRSLATITLGFGVLALLGCGGSSDGPDPAGFPDFKAASLVIGQPDFTSDGSNRGEATPAANSLQNPSGVAVSADYLLIADWGNSRILGFNGTVQANDPHAGFVIGQPDFGSRTAGLGDARLDSPRAVCLHQGRVVVADTDNNRVLIWTSVPESGEPANFVLGQPSFTSNAPGTGSQGMNKPSDACIANGRLFVTDRSNHRVLVWGTVPTASNVPADYALGQPNLTSHGPTLSASGLNEPVAIWSDGTRVAVGDYGNNRVLIWNTMPSASGAPADLVLGKPDFNTGDKSKDPLDGVGPVDGLAFDGARLFASGIFARVLVFEPFPTVIDPPPVGLLGQSDFAHRMYNDDDQDGVDDGQPSARTFRGTARIQYRGGRLYVADFGNHRVLVFDL